MVMIREANINLQYRSKNDTALLEVRMTFKDGNKWKSIYTRSNIEVSRKFWDEYRKSAIFRDRSKIALRDEIDNTTKELQSFISERLQTNIEPISSSWLKNAVNDYYLPPIVEVMAPIGLIPFFDYFLKEKTQEGNSKRSKNIKTISKGTQKAYRVVRNKLEAFQSDMSRAYKMTDIDTAFLKDFQEWSLDMGYSNSVINKNVSQIKTLCRFAEENEIEIDKRIYSFVGLGKSLNEEIEETPIVTLSFDELKKLQSLELKPEFDNVRDWLIISCYTGQRISDFMRFDKSMIEKKEFGRIIKIKQQKTGKVVTIPLTQQVEAILKKRGGKFPEAMSSQKFNDDVKVVCRIAGINQVIKGKVTETTDNGNRRIIGEYKKWQLISSHIGRRSFATNYYGVLHTAKLKDITGHGTEAMLLKYIGEKSDKQQDQDSRVAFEAMINV